MTLETSKINTASIDLNELFSQETSGEYTHLYLKNPAQKVIIYDPGLYHTAICKSSLSKVDTKDGKLYYRGVAVEEKIEENFLEVAGEILFGDEKEKIEKYIKSVHAHFVLIPEQKTLLDTLSLSIHPMDILGISMTALSGEEKKVMKDPSDMVEKAGFLTAQVAITVAYYYTRIKKMPWIVPDPTLPYSEKILSFMHAGEDPERLKELSTILNTIMILHAEHGQNCSAATVRNIASAKGSIYTGVASGIAAFNGMIHGGASQLVSEMYEELLLSNLDVDTYVDRKIMKKELLMGFGQRTYNRIPNCWDPRVETMYKILTSPSFHYPEVEPYKNAAIKLIARVTHDPFFASKNLTPNPDLFNCIFYKLFGVPKEMNTMMLALGRIVGWSANFLEHSNHRYPLTRPCDITL